MPLIMEYEGFVPQIHSSAFIAPNVSVMGDVFIDEDSSVWYNSVLRGDVAPIRIGKRTNIQDGTVVHTSRFNGPCVLGDDITIGHQVMLHACHIHNNAFVGMSASVLDGAVVESFGFVAAHSLIAPNKVVKSYELWAGVPAKFVRNITEEEIELIKSNPPHYVILAQKHKKAVVGVQPTDH